MEDGSIYTVQPPVPDAVEEPTGMELAVQATPQEEPHIFQVLDSNPQGKPVAAFIYMRDMYYPCLVQMWNVVGGFGGPDSSISMCMSRGGVV